MITNFASYALKRGGKLTELELPFEHSEGLGVANPSIFFKDGKTLCNIRRVNYFFHISENGRWSSWYGPSSYHHPDDDITLTTENYMCELDEDCRVVPSTVKHVDYSRFWTKPQWGFVGEEDCRIVEWDGHMYLTGCRRDTETTGISRMELTEIDENAVEIQRHRLPAKGKNDSYCEKNWMPILDEPYRYVTWSNPCCISEYNPKDNTTREVLCKEYKIQSKDPLGDLRGSSQVVTVGDYRIAVVHEVDLWLNRYKEKNAKYYTRFIVWDRDWNLVGLSQRFWFMGFRVEFGVGLAYKNETFYITFSVYDNASYVLRIPKAALYGFVGIENEARELANVVPTTKAEYYAFNQDDPYAAYDVALEQFSKKQYACAYAYFLRCANITELEPLKYRQIGYDAFYMCIKCMESVGRRKIKIINMLGQLVDWDPERYEGYYELSRFHYGSGEHKNEHQLAFAFASMAKSKAANIVPVTGIVFNKRRIIENILFQYYICAYRCSKDYVAVDGLRELRDNGSEEIRKTINELGLSI